MSECDATVGQVAKGTTASFALGPHGASVCGRTEHALPGVGVVGGVWALVGGCADGVCGMFGGVALGLVPADGVGVDEIGVFAPVGAVFGLVGAVFGLVGGVFGGRIVPFAPVGAVFGLVGGRSDGVCGGCAFAVGVFESASAAFGAAEGETGAKRSASDGAGGADVDEATEEGAAERRLC